jgi:ATP-dependent DNA helicase RecG
LTLLETPEAYETSPRPGATWANLDEAALRKYFAARAPGVLDQPGLTLEALASGQRFATRRGADVVPTVAGCALFGSHPEWLQPAWRVTALRLSGSEITAPIVDRLDTEGPALRAIEQAEAFLRRNLRVARLLVDRGTHFEEQDVPEYPLAAAHEAVANAVAHRDYAAPAQVFVRLYEDRLEIQNPGALLPGLTLEQVLAGGESRRRNPVIAAARVSQRWAALPGYPGLAACDAEVTPPTRTLLQATIEDADDNRTFDMLCWATRLPSANASCRATPRR